MAETMPGSLGSRLTNHLPQVAPEAMGALLRETFRAMVESVEHQFDDTDLSLTQWLTLKLIGNGSIQCIGDVNREIGMESGTSTRLVDQLELKGLLERRRSEVDRRVVAIVLTVQGAAVLRDMQPRLASFWLDQLSEFSDVERTLLFSGLRRLRDRLLSATEYDAVPKRASR